MCRSVWDTAALLQAIAGYDPLDVTSVDATVPDYLQALQRPVSRFRLGIPRAVFYEKLDPEIEAATNRAIVVLRKLTAGVRDVVLPEYESLPVSRAEAYAYHAPNFTKTPELYQGPTRARLELGSKVTADAYIRGRLELERLRRAVATVFAGVDLLITPTTPFLAATIAEERAKTELTSASLRNTTRFNVYGLPAVSIPCGFTGSGLPIGVQISGPRFGESSVLALAHAYERATDWHKRRPAI
jgi:aspartyl-tRNA(Asn)/glutamyl-tRNA(Gln) amidotransferase subunit A